MVDQATAPKRDFWPLTRLIVISLGLCAASRLLPGWGELFAGLPNLAAAMLRTALGLLFLSPAAAHIYLALMIAPLVIFILLTDWIYDAVAWLLRPLTRSSGGLGLRSTALGLELGTIIALAEFLRSAVSSP